MRSTACTAAFLFVVTCLALVEQQVDCGCLTSFMGKLSKDWQWIDNFLKDGSDDDRINKYFAENQAEMEPKLREAFKIVVEANNVKPEESGCSESESLKVARLFEAVKLDMNAVQEQKASAIHKLALGLRKNYGNYCAREYDETLTSALNNLDPRKRAGVEKFGIAYAKVCEYKLKDFAALSSGRKLTTSQTTLVGQALAKSVSGWLPAHQKQINKETGREEYNWVEVIGAIRAGCEAYQSRVKDALENIAKDSVAPLSLARLNYGGQIWRSWTASNACDRLEKLGVAKVAAKLAAEIAAGRRMSPVLFP